MSYALLLLIFGVGPLFVLWLARPRLVRRKAASLQAIALLALLASVPWELLSVNRICRYMPRILSAPEPVEELLFFLSDGLLVGTLALALQGERFEACAARSRPGPVAHLIAFREALSD